MTAAELAGLRDWIGRTEVREDVVTAAPLVALSALLDRDDPAPRPGDAAPPLAHWLYFLPAYPQSQVGHDGHAARGSFMPPIDLPRRMWAGSRLEFTRPLAVGAEVTRVSTIKDIVVKEGRSGPLAFVTVRHELGDAKGPLLSDEHDIVYRGETPLTRSRRRRKRRATRPGARHQPGSRAVVPLLRGHLQQPSHPLRPALRNRRRRATRAWWCTGPSRRHSSSISCAATCRGRHCGASPFAR
jgi:3-methylfumaryl-CoA hydratase